MSDRLDPKQLLQFRDALAEAFNQDTFAAFHDSHWTKRPFKNIVGPNDTDPVAFGRVLEKANTECWWRDLLAKVRQERPASKTLRDFEIATLLPGQLDQEQIDRLRDILNAAFIREDFNDFVAERLERKPGDMIAPNDNDLQAIAKVLDTANSASPPWWRLILSEARISRPNDANLRIFEPQVKLNGASPPPLPSYEAVILGSPSGSLVSDVQEAVEDLKMHLGKSGVSFTSFPDKWAKKGTHPELLAWASAERRPVLILPIDNAWARAYALNPLLLKKDVEVAAGAPSSSFKYIIWLPQETEDDDFADRLKAQPEESQAFQSSGSEEDSFWFHQGDCHQLNQLVERFLGREPLEGEPPPPFGYQDIEYKKMPGGNIIRDIIIPGVSAPLANRYIPPTWEDVPFFDEEDATRIINDMMSYQFGVVAIHNFNDSIDQDGSIPVDFRDRILTIDKLVQKFARENRVDPKNILCLGIIATTKPEKHAFQYLRGATNEIIARWRFVAVAVESPRDFRVDSGHLNSLVQELQRRVSRAGQKMPQ
ncbi:hypothetical protein NKG95_31805 [Mesorhizobium sp. M1423]|uniref:effector-associated domain EAD1-containing protein n=1 Tax=Mesorhizobium sp. M1423 TaxID=2957101 RepID=UPI00333CB8AD